MIIIFRSYLIKLLIILFFYVSQLSIVNAKTKNNEINPQIFKHLALSSTVSTLDPLFSGDIYSSQIILSIYDTLYEYKYLDSSFSYSSSVMSSLPSFLRILLY